MELILADSDEEPQHEETQEVQNQVDLQNEVQKLRRQAKKDQKYLKQYVRGLKFWSDRTWI